MSGNLTAVREMSGIFGKHLVREKLPKTIVHCIFASIQVFSTGAGMISVTLNMPSAVNSRGFSQVQ